MMAAALLGHEIGITQADDVSRIVSLVRRIGPAAAVAARIAARTDRGNALGQENPRRKLRFVLTSRIGKALRMTTFHFQPSSA